MDTERVLAALMIHLRGLCGPPGGTNAQSEGLPANDGQMIANSVAARKWKVLTSISPQEALEAKELGCSRLWLEVTPYGRLVLTPEGKLEADRLLQEEKRGEVGFGKT